MVTADQLKVLVTRPPEQARRLAERLIETGYQPVLAPMIEIQKLSVGEGFALFEPFHQQGQLDGIIAISANAFRFFLEHLYEQDLPMPFTKKWFAIGNATASAMRAENIEPELPSGEFNTDGLLALPDFQSVSDKRYAVLAGMGGRKKLENMLRERGAIVHKVELYKRMGKSISDIQISEQPDIMTCMSGETLEVLHRFVVSKKLNSWFDKVLLVPSSRIAELAFRKNFRRVRVSEFASEKSLLIALSHAAAEL